MHKFLLPLFLLCFSLPLLGCGGAPETSQAGNDEMKELEADSNYEAQMMGESK